ncbi:DUF6783 domain-containing protein, partial [Enterocloster lavalensis]|uniref:DUF6783 domain-containing protein n=1 Tax=Enterocloster lavalensis TaxID=460384 RepID=UPI002665D85C
VKRNYLVRCSTRVCLKIHFRHLHAPLCGIFDPNSLDVARYDAFIWAKSPTKRNAHLTESNFQTHPMSGGQQNRGTGSIRGEILKAFSAQVA